jgi:hypothetical protein
VFYGHKFFLSTHSYWFEAAFTGEFQEKESQEIILHDDDADALEAMLYYLYCDKTKWTGRLDTNTYLLFCLNLYQVADKYDCPIVQEAAHLDFRTGFKKYWDNAAQCEVVDGFREIVNNLYEGPQSLLKYSLQIISNHRESQLTGSTGKLRPLILKTARDVAEFGRDILLHIMEQTGKQGSEKVVTVKLEFMYIVKCPKCEFVWMRPRSQVNGCCWTCGKMRLDWNEYEIEE